MKDLKISKELLSEVLGIRTILMEPILEPGNKVGYLVYGSQNTLQEVRNNHKQINIYEFAFKCKEWAKTKKMYINSIYNEFYWDRIEKEYFADIPNKNKSFYADTEVAAIFKACEWILKETKDKQ